MRALLLAAVVLALGCRSEASPLTVGAATSLRLALPALIAAHGDHVVVSYAASGAIARQVVGGAPIDLVLLAAPEPVDALITAGDLDGATRRRIAGNALVLVARAADADDLDLTGARVAVGDPRVVPAGVYARRALEARGLWGRVDAVYGHDVAAVLTYVRRGEARYGLVYATEAASVPDVRIVERYDVEVEIVGAAARDASPRAAAFLDFLGTPRAKEILAAHGFTP